MNVREEHEHAQNRPFSTFLLKKAKFFNSLIAARPKEGEKNRKPSLTLKFFPDTWLTYPAQPTFLENNRIEGPEENWPFNLVN